MGEALPPHAFLPAAHADQIRIKSLPGDPALEAETGYWHEQLKLWVAEDQDDLEILKQALGPQVPYIMAAELRGEALP